MTESKKISASCDCGQLVLDITTPVVTQVVCHCSDCRGMTGLPYVDIAFFEPDGCKALGESRPTTMKGGSGIEKTYFACPECGAAVYATVGALKGACVVIASRLSSPLDESSTHIWTSEKVSNVEIPSTAVTSLKGPPEPVRSILVSNFLDRSR
ncbi:GFA family protein [Marinobacter suaedae]|uniref:GFA family protein n=1 Tax=Marinobacter suaedae TaxID=3057675 RepID=UPI003B969560